MTHVQYLHLRLLKLGRTIATTRLCGWKGWMKIKVNSPECAEYSYHFGAEEAKEKLSNMPHAYLKGL